MFLRLKADPMREVKAFDSEMDAFDQRYMSGREKACTNQARSGRGH